MLNLKYKIVKTAQEDLKSFGLVILVNSSQSSGFTTWSVNEKIEKILHVCTTFFFYLKLIPYITSPGR